MRLLWEERTLVLTLALFAAALALAGCPSRHVQTTATIQEQARTTWAATNAVESKQRVEQQKTEAVKRVTRRVERRPDGTVSSDTTVTEEAGAVVQTRTDSAVAASGSASATAETASKTVTARKETRVSFPWWLWVGGAVVLIAVGVLVARRLLRFVA